MFPTHMLNEQGKKEMSDFKSKLAATLTEVEQLMVEGREKALFKTKIEEAVFFGAKAIAGKEGNFDSVTHF